MATLKLSRRTVIRGAGSIAVALPWLEAMGGAKAASSGGVPFKRFVTVYQPGGTVRQGSIGDQYTPTGTETSFTMSTILKPLDPVKANLLIIDGLNCTCGDQSKYNVEQHQGGGVGWLTGQIQQGAGNYIKGGGSMDQILADRLSTGKAYPSLQFAVRWATGKSHGKLNPMNALYFQSTSPNTPIPPRLDPQDIFKTLFGSATTTTDGGATDPNAAIAPMRRKSILDFVDKRYSTLMAKLGSDDRARLDQHLTQLRDLENRMMIVSQPPTAGASCQPPTKVDTTGYNPTSALNSADDGSIKDIATDMMIPTVGKFLMDMLVMTLACDRTGVIGMQWTDTEAKHTFPWLNLPEHHHYYQHDGGFRPNECTQIDVWYSTMHLYLIQKMQGVDMGGHSLLDESLVFFGTEIADPPSHAKSNMPLMLAGGDGKTLRTGRWIKCGGVPHNKLLTSIFNLFGDTRTSFGDSRVESSPLTNLT